jgi:hypothetical protein
MKDDAEGPGTRTCGTVVLVITGMFLIGGLIAPTHRALQCFEAGLAVSAVVILIAASMYWWRGLTS